MDTTKPPLICPTCNEPITSVEPFEVRYPVDEEGEQAGSLVTYHQGHAPPTD